MYRKQPNFKKLRKILALATFLSLTVSLLGFQILPRIIPHGIASFQLVPSWMGVGTGVMSVIGLLSIFILTLVAGRVYCSVLCPLGVWQDIVARIADWFRKKPILLRYAPAWNKLRYGILGATLVFMLLGMGGSVLAWMDPYSNYGRIASMLFKPLLATGVNLGIWILGRFGVTGVEFWEVGTLITWGSGFVLAFFMLVTYLSSTKGRLYCNTICPVGALLGLVARKARYRLSIDHKACAKCAECLRSCKAQCIDLKNGSVDMSRCVGCFNCVAECDQSAIGYDCFPRISFGSTPQDSKEPPCDPSVPLDTHRRTFIHKVMTGAVLYSAFSGVAKAGVLGDAGKASGYSHSSGGILPPGAKSEDHFLSRCTGCQLCVGECPSHVLKPSLFQYGSRGLFKPRLDYSASYCRYDCARCGEVCPNGAIEALKLEIKQKTRIGLASINLDHCMVARDGVDCWVCAQKCPVKAIPHGENDLVPKVDVSICIGCGACECHCPVDPKAATVSGRKLQTHIVRQADTINY